MTMDPEAAKGRSDGLRLATQAECRFKCWTNSEHDFPQPDVWLGESQHAITLDLVLRYAQGVGDAKTPRLVAISTSGDPAPRHGKLQINRGCFDRLFESFAMTSYISHVLTEEMFHLSRHTIYEEGGEKPTGLVLLMRIPRNSQSITLLIRISLRDMSTIFFIAAAQESTVDYLHGRIVSAASLLEQNPLFVLGFILEERLTRYWAHMEELMLRVNEVETMTGMVQAGWKRHMLPESVERLSSFDSQLKQLHASHMDLCHCDTFLKFFMNLDVFCRETLREIDDQRADLGLDRMTKQQTAQFLELVGFWMTRYRYMHSKVQEMLDRLRTQVSVVFSHIAQRDSNINLKVASDSNRVANLAARDSQVMKTIAVLTLTFLPTTLVTYGARESFT
ncbi:hypothetical protein B0T16DRAFT_173970 [Cercophora newfieldiana]|uniref:Uncharacterized protein n=1 Tax=Cercophora newfieldiana TaxID=92897 RepID=A0AA39XZZ5_9PEZI|nr:hypothetical protein B0T16DRAFT_173970 [Cercophora newfieldiana]